MPGGSPGRWLLLTLSRWTSPVPIQVRFINTSKEEFDTSSKTLIVVVKVAVRRLSEICKSEFGTMAKLPVSISTVEVQVLS